MLARQTGGVFILRIDDTDLERSTKAFEEDILDSLRWLGMSWDEGPGASQVYAPYYQRERIAQHVQKAERLLQLDKAYRDDEGVVRLRYPEETIVIEDLICGTCSFEPEALGNEPVILRSDGTPTYHLASVADDIDHNITHVIRGQDHLTNTAKHKVMFEALGAAVPQFAHLPLILGEDGSKLSKRNTTGLTTVREFQEAGYVPEALNNFLALLGWSHPDEKELFSIDEIVDLFSIERVNQTAAKFETPKLDHINAWWLRHLPAERVANDLLPFAEEYREAIDQRGAAYWESAVASMQSSLTSLKDVRHLAPLLFSLDVELGDDIDSAYPVGEARNDLQEVVARWKEVLSETPLDLDRDSYTEQQFKDLLKQVKKSVSAKGKTIFQGVRLAITGQLSGPELTLFVPFVSRDTLLERVQSVLQRIS
jgi:glutamyl-tRNA synthetase